MAEIKTSPTRLIDYVVTEAARQDVEEILSFHRAPSSLGDLFQRDLFLAIRHVREWPYTGHRRTDLTKRDVCIWTFEPFYLVIHVKDDLITIIAVLHSKRNVAKILRKRLKRPL